MNERLSEMLGYKKQEMLGKPAFDFVKEAEVSKASKKLEDRRNGKKEQFEFLLNGKDWWALLSAVPIMEESTYKVL